MTRREELWKCQWLFTKFKLELRELYFQEEDNKPRSELYQIQKWIWFSCVWLEKAVAVSGLSGRKMRPQKRSSNWCNENKLNKLPFIFPDPKCANAQTALTDQQKGLPPLHTNCAAFVRRTCFPFAAKKELQESQTPRQSEQVGIHKSNTIGTALDSNRKECEFFHSGGNSSRTQRILAPATDCRTKKKLVHALKAELSEMS